MRTFAGHTVAKVTEDAHKDILHQGYDMQLVDTYGGHNLNVFLWRQPHIGFRGVRIGGRAAPLVSICIH